MDHNKNDQTEALCCSSAAQKVSSWHCNTAWYNTICDLQYSQSVNIYVSLNTVVWKDQLKKDCCEFQLQRHETPVSKRWWLAWAVVVFPHRQSFGLPPHGWGRRPAHYVLVILLFSISLPSAEKLALIDNSLLIWWTKTFELDPYLYKLRCVSTLHMSLETSTVSTLASVQCRVTLVLRRSKSFLKGKPYCNVKCSSSLTQFLHKSSSWSWFNNRNCRVCVVAMAWIIFVDICTWVHKIIRTCAPFCLEGEPKKNQDSCHSFASSRAQNALVVECLINTG